MRSCKNRLPRAWSTVNVRGLDVECVSGRGRQLLVPIEGESLGLIVEHLSARAGEAVQHPCAAPAGTFGQMLTANDAGKIAWRPNRQASGRSVGFWQIIYRTKGGSVHRGRNGLSVPCASLAGKTMSTPDQLNAARLVLKKAREMWNLTDGSTADRIPEESE